MEVDVYQDVGEQEERFEDSNKQQPQQQQQQQQQSNAMPLYWVRSAYHAHGSNPYTLKGRKTQEKIRKGKKRKMEKKEK